MSIWGWLTDHRGASEEGRSHWSSPLLEQLEPRLLLSAAIPSTYDQYMLELVNRAREDPEAEVARYDASHWDGTPDLNEGLAPGTISSAAKPPVAFNVYLIDAARGHSQWMLDNDTFGHTGEGGSTPSERAVAAGYTLTAPWSVGENIAWKGTMGSVDVTQYVWELEGQFFGDAGVAGRGHRIKLMYADLREVGIGVLTGAYTDDSTTYNSVMVAEDFAYSGSSIFLTGVAYDDSVTDDDFYTPGEGLDAVSITAIRQSDSSEYSTTTWASGGYSLAVPSGTYEITAASAELGTLVVNNVVVSTVNVKLDFTPHAAPVLDPIGDKSVDEDSLLSFTATAADGDIPPNNLTFSLGPGAPAGASIGSGTGEFTWTPTELQGPAQYDVTIRVTDDGTPNLSDSETFTIDVTDSNETVTDFVIRFYQECLQRDPDPDGLSNWVADLYTGIRTGSDVAEGFIFSPEYLLRFRTDSEFVDDSYHAFFDREPDADGKANWLGDLERGVSRQSVLNGFVYSLEFVNLSNRFGTIPYTEAQQQRYTVRLFIRRFYVEVLEREADEPGLTYWADGLIDGSLVGSQLAWNFIFSPEYLLRFRTDSEFLDDSYHAFFGREPDAPGKANWLAALAGGASRQNVLDGFTDSLEFANLCGVYGIQPR